jgi:hypothetical protein
VKRKEKKRVRDEMADALEGAEGEAAKCRLIKNYKV